MGSPASSTLSAVRKTRAPRSGNEESAALETIWEIVGASRHLLSRSGELHALRPGFFDHETGRVECADNPFQAKVTHALGTHAPAIDLDFMALPTGFEPVLQP